MKIISLALKLVLSLYEYFSSFLTFRWTQLKGLTGSDQRAQKAIHLILSLSVFLIQISYLGCSTLTPKKPSAKVDFEILCDQNDALACGEFGHALWLEADASNSNTLHERAKNYLQKGCELKSAAACDWLGSFIEHRAKIPRTEDANALPWYIKGCDLKLGSACNHASLLFWSSPKVPQDQKKSIQYAEKSCLFEPAELNNCRSYGQSLYYQNNQDDWKKAVVIFERGCSSNDLESCLLLGIMYREGRGIEANKKQAFQLFSKVCNAGFFRGCSLKATVEPDLALQAEDCRQACDGDDIYGCNCLGHRVALGRGVEKNAQQAAKLFAKGCSYSCKEQNCDEAQGEACAYWAGAFRDGAGVAKDLPRAYALLVRSCKMNYRPGCYDLAYHLQNGLGTVADLTQAVPLYERLCSEGQVEACLNLADIHLKNGKEFKDLPKAQKILKDLCDQKNAMACNNLGDAMENNFFGSPNNAVISDYYYKACQMGDSFGCCSLGVWISKKKARPEHLRDPLPLLKKGCLVGCSEGCDELKKICKLNSNQKKSECL